MEVHGSENVAPPWASCTGIQWVRISASEYEFNWRFPNFDRPWKRERSGSPGTERMGRFSLVGGVDWCCGARGGGRRGAKFDAADALSELLLLNLGGVFTAPFHFAPTTPIDLRVWIGLRNCKLTGPSPVLHRSIEESNAIDKLLRSPHLLNCGESSV